MTPSLFQKDLIGTRQWLTKSIVMALEFFMHCCDYHAPPINAPLKMRAQYLIAMFFSTTKKCLVKMETSNVATIMNTRVSITCWKKPSILIHNRSTLWWNGEWVMNHGTTVMLRESLVTALCWHIDRLREKMDNNYGQTCWISKEEMIVVQRQCMMNM